MTSTLHGRAALRGSLLTSEDLAAALSFAFPDVQFDLSGKVVACFSESSGSTAYDISASAMRRGAVAVTDPIKGANQTWAKISGVWIKVRKTDPTAVATGTVAVEVNSVAAGSHTDEVGFAEGEFFIVNKLLAVTDASFQVSVDLGSATNLTVDTVIIGAPA